MSDDPEGDRRFAVYRDGTQRSPSGLAYIDAVGWLHRAQGQSVHHATTYEGWEIREQAYCRHHDIFDCPFAHQAPQTP